MTVGTKVFFVGGDGTDVVDIYDDATGSWSATTLSAAFGCFLLDPATAIGPLGLFYSRCTGELFAYDDALGVRYCTPGAPTSAVGPARLDVQGVDRDPRRALDVQHDSGKRQAALLADLATGRIAHDGVDEHVQAACLLADAQVDDADAPGHAQLVGREPDARGEVHRVDHVPHELTHLVVDSLHGLGGPQQDRIRVEHDGSNGHLSENIPFEAIQQVMVRPARTGRPSPCREALRLPAVLSGGHPPPGQGGHLQAAWKINCFYSMT